MPIGSNPIGSHPIAADASTGNSYVKSIAESVSVSDAVARVIVGARSITETISVSDAITRQAIVARSIAESITAPSDAVAVVTGYARSVSESISASDSVVRAFVGARNISESVSASDSVSRLVVSARSISESVTVSDSIARFFAGHRAIAESVPTPSDSVSRGGVVHGVAAQNLNRPLQHATGTSSVIPAVRSGQFVYGGALPSPITKKRKRFRSAAELELERDAERAERRRKAEELAAAARVPERREDVAPTPAPTQPELPAPVVGVARSTLAPVLVQRAVGTAHMRGVAAQRIGQAVHDRADAADLEVLRLRRELKAATRQIQRAYVDRIHEAASKDRNDMVAKIMAVRFPKAVGS
jgi:hypothetical protein